METDEIKQALEDLNQRVARIERELSLTRDVTGVIRQPTPPPPGDISAPRPRPPREEHTPAIHPAGSSLPATPLDALETLRAVSVATSSPPPAPPAKVASRDGGGRSWEVLIGMNWMAWAGAIFVVLAAAFFVKLAYDQGWFGRLSELTKCLMAASFGGILLIAGELARRRIGRVAAASLFGAGIATLYLTAYATFRWFDLLSETGAFWLLLLVALLGFGITIHARMITTGVLATLGGYLTPLLLPNTSAFPAALPLYLTMLLAVALLLSAWRPEPFRLLRYVGVCYHGVVTALWAFNQAPSQWQLALVFMGIWWILVNGEGIYAALRGQSPLGNPITSLFTTAWVAVVGHWLLVEVQPGGRDWLGLFGVSLAALAALTAVAFGPGLKILQHLPKRAMEKFAVTLWAQAGILLAAAIGFQFDDFGQTIGWLALGYACVEVGRRLPSRGVDLFGLVVGGLALGRVAFFDSLLTTLKPVFWSFADVRITYWGLLALAAVLTTYASALRLQVRGTPPRVRLPIVLMELGTLGWLVVCLSQCEDLAVTWGWLAAALVLIASARIGWRQRCFEFGSALVGLSAFKWLVFDAGAARFSSTWDPTAVAPVSNELFGLALVIAVGFGWAAWVRYRRAEDSVEGRWPSAWQCSLLYGAVFLLLALSFQVEHALGRFVAQGWNPVWPPMLLRALWWTLLWAAGGLTLLLIGRARQWVVVHTAGWSILVLAALAWLSIDTLAWRLNEGVVLAAVAVNLQFIVGALTAGLLALACWSLRSQQGEGLPDKVLIKPAMAIGYGLIVAIGLWLGSLEIDRFLAPEAQRVANAGMARQTGLSIYWGLYAIGLVSLGFARQLGWARYAGLGLLTVTLGKVLVLDMAGVRYAYRVLSFLGVGTLLLVTSVAYAKLGRRVLARGPTTASDGDPSEPT